MSPAINLIEKDSLTTTKEGFELKIRSRWYRSLPLSCVEEVSLSIDGQAIPREDISVEIDGRVYSVDGLAEEVERYWFVQDPAILRVTKNGLVETGNEYEIEALVTLRAPYIIIGPGKFLTMPNKEVCKQKAV